MDCAKKPFLYIVRGVPSSGKSTFCKRVFKNAFHVENDMFHYRGGEYCYSGSRMPDAIRFCANAASMAVECGMDVVVSNTFTKKSFIDSYKKLLAGKDYEFKVFRMMHDFKTNVHDVPDAVLDSMRNHFEDYPEEIYVYPNLNRQDDPIQREYIYTNVRTGDKIRVARFKDHKLVRTVRIADGKIDGSSFETETCQATVVDVIPGAYDYMNIHYTEDDTGAGGLVTGGFVEKL